MNKLIAVSEAATLGLLKRLPVVGPAVDVVDNIGQRLKLLELEDRVSEIGKQITDFEASKWELVHKEMQRFLDSIRDPDVTSQEFTTRIQNLRAIQRDGWEPVFFGGVLVDERQRRLLEQDPGRFGAQILYPEEHLDRDALHFLINVDGPRIVEVAPSNATRLICHSSDKPDTVIVPRRLDMWAIPAENRLLDPKGRPIGERSPRSFRAGKIKKLGDKRFGFIDGPTDVFFHESVLRGLEFDSLRVGQRVAYRCVKGPKGLRASCVRPIVDHGTGGQ